MSGQFDQSLKAITAAFPKKPTHLQRFYAGALRDAGEPADKWISALKDRLSSAAKAEREARQIFRTHFGTGKYRISVSGAVYAFGQKPDAKGPWEQYAESVERAIERLRQAGKE